ncbi:kinase-like domain-containing protein [Pisolithus albus]|nr:kinase-like domain-containing protein [Pisolithus albus]
MAMRIFGVISTVICPLWHQKKIDITHRVPDDCSSEVDRLTDEQIVSLRPTCPNICLTEDADTDVRLIAPDTVAKSQVGMEITEADAMTLVRTHTTIPVPKVRRFIDLPDEGAAILLMEYIKGETLEQCWDHLSFWRKLRIAWVLRGYIRQLRKIRVRPIEIPGPVGVEPLRCKGRWFTDWGAGPFVSYSDMTEWFNSRLAVAKRFEFVGLDPDEPPFDHSHVPLVFTHQDISMRNIIVGEDDTVWLCDWAWAGFYPEYFEYVGMVEYDRTPLLWRFFVPFISGFHRTRHRLLCRIGWAVTVGARMK